MDKGKRKMVEDDKGKEERRKKNTRNAPVIRIGSSNGEQGRKEEEEQEDEKASFESAEPYNKLKFVELAQDPTGEHKRHVLRTACEGRILVVSDAIPKADFHRLIIPTEPGLYWPKDLRRHHIALLEEMKEVGTELAMEFLENHPYHAIRFGFHSHPSMKQLHLHLLSQELSKTTNEVTWKKNTTRFFMDIDSVIEELRVYGSLRTSSKKVLRRLPLACNRCGRQYESLDSGIKEHVKTCPFPESMKNSGLLLGHKLQWAACQQDGGQEEGAAGSKSGTPLGTRPCKRNKGSGSTEPGMGRVMAPEYARGRSVVRQSYETSASPVPSYNVRNFRVEESEPAAASGGNRGTHTSSTDLQSQAAAAADSNQRRKNSSTTSNETVDRSPEEPQS